MLSPKLTRYLPGFQKKNKKQLQIINKKIEEIRSKPEHDYKFLRNPLQGFNRIHIDKHFVLIFRIDHKNKIVEVCYYDHHDKIYQWQPKVDE